MRAAREALRPRRRLAVRQPGAVQRPGATSPPTRATRRRDAAMARELGVDVLFAPAAPSEVYPAGFATTVHVDGPRRGARGRRRAAPATSPASAPSWPSSSTWSSPTSPTSARRTPSRSPCCGAWCATSTSPVRARRHADRARARRARALEPQRPPRRATTARARWPCRARCARRAAAVADGERDAGAHPRRRAGGDWHGVDARVPRARRPRHLRADHDRQRPRARGRRRARRHRPA